MALCFQVLRGAAGGSLESGDRFVVFFKAVAGESGVVVRFRIVGGVYLRVGVFLFGFLEISVLESPVAVGDLRGELFAVGSAEIIS